MSEPFIAEIKMFAGNFAPRGYAFCNGQLLPISQNTALFSLIGTIYGGDGRTTMALPDLRGRVAIHAGQGPGLSDYRLGSRGGAETHTLTTAQMPSHNHSMHAENKVADQTRPTNRLLGVTPGATYVDTDPAANVTMDNGSIGNNGGGQSFGIRQPFLTINYIIALQGIFPSRS